jgi:hypothetical protein
MNLQSGEGNLHFQTMSVGFKGFFYQKNFERGVTFWLSMEKTQNKNFG